MNTRSAQEEEEKERLDHKNIHKRVSKEIMKEKYNSNFHLHYLRITLPSTLHLTLWPVFSDTPISLYTNILES